MLRGAAGAEEKNARVLMAYHHPWTLVKAEHDEQVPHVDRLLQGCQSFAAALCEWQKRGVTCKESKHYVINYSNMSRARPSGRGEDSNSEDLLSDEELIVGKE